MAYLNDTRHSDILEVLKMGKLRFEYLPLEKIDISISNVRKANLEEGTYNLKKSKGSIINGNSRGNI
jgi:hypothetical protein